MGLVARVIEAAGIPTVVLNMIWVYQRLVGMPRVAAIEYPFGRPFGDAVQRQAVDVPLAGFARGLKGWHLDDRNIRDLVRRQVPREPHAHRAAILDRQHPAR